MRFSYNLYEHDRKVPFATVFGGRKHRNKFNFLSESELGCGPQDSVGKFTFICHFKRDDGSKRGNVKKSAHFILIVRNVFVALAVVVPKALYVYEIDSSILVLLQTRMIKYGKVSR